MAEINGAGPEVVTLAVSAGGHIELHFRFVIFHYTCTASPPAKLATHYTRNCTCDPFSHAEYLAVKMTTTTMHFGPEWMRTKGTARPAPEPLIPAATPAGASTTYSALAAPTPNLPPQSQDVSNPFRYPKEEMLRIYKEGGGRGGLGLEVERWEGIVREVGYEPVGLKEMGESEKKVRTCAYRLDSSNEPHAALRGSTQF